MPTNIIQKLADSVKKVEKVLTSAEQLKKDKDKSNEIINIKKTKKG